MQFLAANFPVTAQSAFATFNSGSTLSSVTMKSALLIIDVQNDMFSMEYGLHEPDKLLSVIEKLIVRSRESGASVIYVQHNSKKGNRFRNGTDGWRIHSRIAPSPGDHIIQKTTPDSFYASDLDLVLKSENIERLVICGIQSELCVDTTTRAANSRDYKVTLVSDGHSTFDRKSQKSADIVRLENEVLEGWFAQVARSDDVTF